MFLFQIREEILDGEDPCDGERQDRILLDQYVHPIHIEDEHAPLQIIERLAWAIGDASHAERMGLGKR
jgi:hypothetical protein